MPHSLILGMTGSGKTTLSKKLARQYRSNKIGVIVLDPMGGRDWEADFVTADPDEFLKVFWASEGCAVFIDESGAAVGRYDREMEQTATMGRHFGHNVHFITQRHAQLSATVRGQCEYLAIFRSSLDDCKIHTREWARPELVGAASLNKGDYLFCGRYGEMLNGNILKEEGIL